MRILVLQGSPQPDGNTQRVLDPVVAAAKEAGADIEVVRLCELKDLTGCRQCYVCQQKTSEPGCVMEDSMLVVTGKALMADVIVWVTPVLCWSIAWPLKIAMDRFSCMFKFKIDGTYRCLLGGRKMAAVIAAVELQKDGGDLAAEVCRRMAEYCENEWLGALVVNHPAAPDGVRAAPDLIKRARAFGHTLASPTDGAPA